ncbi:MAG TPA: OB-fold nucleic acid binding domain-containing protein [Ilumatobacteraceae bacterium]
MVLLRRKNRDEGSPAPTAEPVGTPIAEARPRQQVCVVGKVTRMTARPTSGQPALAVNISDDTGTVTAVWTGRREIGGITLGRRVAITGVPVVHGERLEFTNPGYTLLSR